MALDWLWAALIGGAGAVVGGAVGGWFVLQASRQQFERDRLAAREDRSHLAAAAIAGEASSMINAVRAWRTSRNADALDAAFDLFYRAVLVQGIVLIDPAVLERATDHIDLISTLIEVARRDETTADDLIGTVVRHNTALTEALESHSRGLELPAYQPLPLDNPKALLSWTPQPSKAPD